MIEEYTMRLKSGEQVSFIGLRRINLFSGVNILPVMQVLDNLCVGEKGIKEPSVGRFILFAKRYDFIVMPNVECGQHYTVYHNTVIYLDRFSVRYGSQIFMTTQSLEFIRVAHKYFSKQPCYDFAYHRLDWSKKRREWDAKVYDRETLEAAKNCNFELR